MPARNAKVARRWPNDVVQKCKSLYLQHYDAEDIARRTGVPAGTIRNWTYGRVTGVDWRVARAEFTQEMNNDFTSMRRNLVTSFEKTLRAHDKICDHVTKSLDSGDKVEASELRDLAASFRDACDVLLRMMGK